MSNVITVTPSTAIPAITTCIELKQPVFLDGGPGIGKSDIFKTVADHLFAKDYPGETGRPYFRDIRAALHDPVDFTGMPHLHENRLHFAPSAMFPDSGSGLVFFDELNRAPVLTQNACFQFILDRKSGNYTLPENWVTAGAGNRESDGGGVMKMPQALANRFIHIHLEPDLDDWCKWALSNNVDPLIVAFLRFKPDLLYKFSLTEHAFPTPRSWSFVNTVINQNNRNLEQPLIAGAVGQAAAVEFMAFLRLYRELPNIDAILIDPEGTPVPNEVSTLYAVSAALASRIDQDNFTTAIKYINRIPTEYAVYTVKDAITRTPTLSANSAFTDWAIAHSNLI